MIDWIALKIHLFWEKMLNSIHLFRLILISTVLASPNLSSAQTSKSVSVVIDAEAKQFAGFVCTGDYVAKEVKPATINMLTALDSTYRGQTDTIKKDGGKIIIQYIKSQRLLNIYTFSKAKGAKFLTAMLVGPKAKTVLVTHQCTVVAQ